MTSTVSALTGTYTPFTSTPIPTISELEAEFLVKKTGLFSDTVQPGTEGKLLFSNLL